MRPSIRLEKKGPAPVLGRAQVLNSPEVRRNLAACRAHHSGSRDGSREPIRGKRGSSSSPARALLHPRLLRISTTGHQAPRLGTRDGMAHACLSTQPTALRPASFSWRKHVCGHVSLSIPHMQDTSPAASCRPGPNLCYFLLHHISDLGKWFSAHSHILTAGLQQPPKQASCLSVSSSSSCTSSQHNLPKHDAL